MSADLTKLILHSSYPAFKNNNVYTGSFTISGTQVTGANTKTFTVALDDVPDMVDVLFNGPDDDAFSPSTDPRPSDGWFSQGFVYVRGDNSGAGYNNYPTRWELFSSINGKTLTIYAVGLWTATPTLTLTNTVCYYRLVDYSVL